MHNIADSLFLNVNNESKLTDLGLAITINLVNKKITWLLYISQDIQDFSVYYILHNYLNPNLFAIHMKEKLNCLDRCEFIIHLSVIMICPDYVLAKPKETDRRAFGCGYHKVCICCLAIF